MAILKSVGVSPGILAAAQALETKVSLYSPQLSILIVTEQVTSNLRRSES